jgi:hypothetical protein
MLRKKVQRDKKRTFQIYCTHEAVHRKKQTYRGEIKKKLGKEWRKKHKWETKQGMKTEQDIRKESNRPISEDQAAIKADQPKKKPRSGSDFDES